MYSMLTLNTYGWSAYMEDLHHVCALSMRPERILDLLELNLQKVVRCHVGSGNQIQILWKSILWTIFKVLTLNSRSSFLSLPHATGMSHSTWLIWCRCSNLAHSDWGRNPPQPWGKAEMPQGVPRNNLPTTMPQNFFSFFWKNHKKFKWFSFFLFWWGRKCNWEAGPWDLELSLYLTKWSFEC